MEDYKRDLEDYFCRFTFGQFVTLILLEIVTLFFVFYLGAHYGPDLMGTREALARKETNLLPKDSPKNVDDIVGSPPIEYTYPEILTQHDGAKIIKVKPAGQTAEEFEKQSQLDAKPKAAEIPVEVPPIQEIKGPVKTAKVEDVKKDEVQKLHEETTGGSEKASSPTTPEAQGAKTSRFAVQVGSFPSSDEASGVQQKWKKKGYSAFVVTGDVPQKGTWYRVRIGRYSSRKEAQAFLEKLKVRERTSGIVVNSD